uniref:Uncharacterized protein n=1 Tax=Setaria viridis TaxID=4556 RepID=A0A4V6DDH7_SETVI|nr:hypothetical protein SEVIR_1G324133v2 [Setaria viridis]
MQRRGRARRKKAYGLAARTLPLQPRKLSCRLRTGSCMLLPDESPAINDRTPTGFTASEGHDRGGTAAAGGVSDVRRGNQ